MTMKPLFIIELIICVACCGLYAQPQWHDLGDLGNTGRLDDICFIHPDTGWVASAGGQIFRTQNGGDTWELQYNNFLYSFRSIGFADRQLGFAGTLEQTLLRTENGGQDWENITNQLPFTPSGLCGMQWLNEHTFFAAGAWFGPAFLLKTHNCGASWTGIDLSEQATALVDVHFVSQDTGFVCGRNANGGVILYTTDGGAAWQEVFNTGISGDYVWKLQFIDRQHAVASVQTFGPSGRLLISNDAGLSWTAKATPDGNVQGIGFVTPQKGWIGGYNTSFYATENAGDSWDFIPFGGWHNRFQVFDTTLVYASGRNVYKYYDSALPSSAGETFVPLFNPQLSVYPNPARSEAAVRFQISKATGADIGLYDSKGALIQAIFNGRLKPGVHQFPVHLNVKPGHYIVGMQLNEGLFSVPLIVH
ncbi:MAG: hypothetical protein KF852_09690 [Saprospiraceae bacterium]|nr:hypothetical protein [Saprospiraceae bacterium]